MSALARGSVTLTASADGLVRTGVLTVRDVALSLMGLAELNVGETGHITVHGDATDGVWSSSDEAVATVENGTVTAIGAGTATITLTTPREEATLALTVTLPLSLSLAGAETMTVGATQDLVVTTTGTLADVTWESSNEAVLTVEAGTVTARAAGTAVVTASLGSLKSSFSITVKKDDSLTSRAQEILAKMTLEEKVGQLFIVGISGTSLKETDKVSLANRHFGNFILMGNNYGTPAEVVSLTTALQGVTLADTGIPAFISTDQEGGNVARFTNGATHFLGEMSLASTGDAKNAQAVATAVGTELRAFGINVNFSPVLDVNNNPNNPIIGVRSFGDDPAKVSAFGVAMIKGYQDAGIMATAKHFPGHGDTSTDSHYGLPSITYDMDRLNAVELVPFKAAIAAGIDAIMTTHILFTTIDADYPATLSKKVITGLLRETLGFQGLVVTDGMNMAAIAKNWGAADAAVLAVNAGVDLLTYTESTTASCTAYDAVLAAAQAGTITQERIDEAVTRILTKKIKQGLMTDPYPASDATSLDFSSHEALNVALLKKSITCLDGSLALSKSDRLTVIGDEANASVVATALAGKGYQAQSASYAATTPTDRDVLVYLTSNPNDARIATINEAAKTTKVIVISVGKPYDLTQYVGVSARLATCGAVPSLYPVLASLLAGEFTPTGMLPVTLS